VSHGRPGLHSAFDDTASLDLDWEDRSLSPFKNVARMFVVQRLPDKASIACPSFTSVLNMY
jgi:hypothetical protein